MFWTLYRSFIVMVLALTLQLWGPVVLKSIRAYAQPVENTHVVKRGENLVHIAKKNGVSWQAMLYANEPYLQEKYEQVCGRLSQEFRTRTETKKAAQGGNFYCNDNKARPYGNTLRPGWRLAVASAHAPASIEQTVIDIKGDKIALVIDDSGSMDDKRQRVAKFYLAALHKFGRRISGVYLYTDKPRRYNAGTVEDLERIMMTSGATENTLRALLEAALDGANTIILVTDERGDDWGDWSKVKGLPPVVAHCLPLSRGGFDCRETLKRLVSMVPGSRYLEDLAEPTARH